MTVSRDYIERSRVDLRLIFFPEARFTEMLFPEFRQSRSQDLEAAFHDAGQFYFGKTKAFLNDIPAFSHASIPLILPRYRVHDIDTQEYWDRAELVFKAIALSRG